MPGGAGYTGPFAASLEAVNRFLLDHAVRVYQRDIIDKGGFSVVSPFTGETLAPSVCHVTNNGDPAHGNIGIAYRLPGEEGLWLLAGSVKDGFPITEALCSAQETSLWSLSEAHCRENLPWKSRLMALERERHWSGYPRADNSPPAVLIGHPNFAHHLWNELPALYQYARHRDRGPWRIRYTYQPLLPLEQFVGGSPADLRGIGSFGELVGFQEHMLTRLGSTRIPTGLREAVIRGVSAGRDRAVTDAPVEKLRGRRPVIWLSLRLDARTPDNQEAFLFRLVCAIAQRYPDAAFVLDGFSYPADFGSAIYRQSSAGDRRGLSELFLRRGNGFLVRQMQSREKNISQYVARFRRKLEKRLSNQVVNVSGMRLVDSIYLAHFADYYVCHAGTLQHKVGWIYNIPGIVHSNTTGTGKGTGRWLARQLEDGVQPAVLGPEYVEDLPTMRTGKPVPRNRDYHIRDIDDAVQEVISDLAARLGLPGAATR